MSEEAEKSAKPKIGIFALSLSVLAAAVGVQNRKNLEQDFEQSSPFPYIIAGIVFTVVFMLTLIFVVKLVLSE
ncbi:MAG: DUF2970 domain-containing protein [Agarilytica sp.]